MYALTLAHHHTMLASQWPTKMYEKVLRIWKEHYWPYDFCWAADMLAETTVHVSYSHINIIYEFPILYLLNKLIFVFNVMIIG